VVKNGILLITIREKVDLALLNTMTFGGSPNQQRTSRKGPIQASTIEGMDLMSNRNKEE
jgi:hypothetical protein